MTSQELGSILLDAFKDCTLEQIIAFQDNNVIDDKLKEKLSPETYEKVCKADALVWIDAIRMLYLKRID